MNGGMQGKIKTLGIYEDSKGVSKGVWGEKILM